MTASWTYYGFRMALIGNGTNGGAARIATRARLYLSTSTPNIDETVGVWHEVSGSGYAPRAITHTDWAYTSNPSRIVLADIIWPFAGNVNGIAGAFITDALGKVMAWWDKIPVINMNPGDSVVLDDLTLRLNGV